MNKIFLITGPAGVGKSTVSKLIAQSLDKSVLIEGDAIYHLVVGGYISPWKEGNHLKLFWENCKSLIKNSIENGYDVVFNYILNEKQVEDIKKSFSKYEIKFVCLMVDENTIVKRDKLRPKDCQMGERALVLLNKMRSRNFDKNNIIDTSNMTEEETYIEILKSDRFVL